MFLKVETLSIGWAFKMLHQQINRTVKAILIFNLITKAYTDKTGGQL